MFGYPTKKPVYEHEVCQTDYYDKHRKELLETLGDKYKVAGFVNGERVSQQEYYNKMAQSKIILAPLGYGEMAPRDVESALLGSILIKPNLDFISTKPNIYVDNDTYLAVNYDWSNLKEKIDYALSNFKELQSKFVENMRKKFIELNKEENLALHLYEIFKNLKEVSIDE